MVGKVLLFSALLGLGAATDVVTAPARGNLRHLRDDSSNAPLLFPSPDGTALASMTTKNDWVEEGVNFVHIRVRFENVDKLQRPICGITFSIEGFDHADPRAQYGNFDVLSNGMLFIPPVTSNPLHYTTLSPNQRPDWFIGAIFPFAAKDHEFPNVAIHDVQFCQPGSTTTTAAATTTKDQQQQP